MSDCCSSKSKHNNHNFEYCPNCQSKGKKVQLITLKGLLSSEAMKQLMPSSDYYFCQSKNCSTVYFNGKQTFQINDVRVTVFQKNDDLVTPVCYCFGYTREMIRLEIHETGSSASSETISKLTRENKCACELRNPQGSCCLGNIAQVVKQEKQMIKA